MGETCWPGETGKMLFHPRLTGGGRVSDRNQGDILIVQYPGPTTGERPIHNGRFNRTGRKAVSEERIDLSGDEAKRAGSRDEPVTN